jgi:lipoprotein-anchoring transpeptidase ErfK/SrfK
MLLLHGTSAMPAGGAAADRSLSARAGRAHAATLSALADAEGTRVSPAERGRLAGKPRRALAAESVGQSLRPVGGHGPRRPAPSLMVRLTRDLRATSRPGGRKVIGVVPAGSKYYRTPTVAWVLELSPNGQYGRVPIPYTSRRKTGWISLRGLKRSHTPYVVNADLSAHGLTVRKLGRVLFRAPMATGAPWSPTPPGLYFVTDRVPFNPRGPLGAFAFGISGIQTRLPAGWHGGNQLAIHGTNNPASIGRSVSAGCLRVARAVLERLKRILALGTPVIIQR